MDTPQVVEWYDFICPFCYVAQARNAILVGHGVDVVERPFQIHPDIPAGGIPSGPRLGPMYAKLGREAAAAGLPLRWPRHLPNTRRALAAAEWIRLDTPDAFAAVHRDLFHAHFVLGENLEDPAVIDRYAARAGVDLALLQVALADGIAERAVAESERLGHEHGVHGTPAWLVDGHLIEGLRPAEEFEQWVPTSSKRA